MADLIAALKGAVHENNGQYEISGDDVSKLQQTPGFGTAYHILRDHQGTLVQDGNHFILTLPPDYGGKIENWYQDIQRQSTASRPSSAPPSAMPRPVLQSGRGDLEGKVGGSDTTRSFSPAPTYSPGFGSQAKKPANGGGLLKKLTGNGDYWGTPVERRQEFVAKLKHFAGELPSDGITTVVTLLWNFGYTVANQHMPSPEVQAGVYVPVKLAVDYFWGEFGQKLVRGEDPTPFVDWLKTDFVLDLLEGGLVAGTGYVLMQNPNNYDSTQALSLGEGSRQLLKVAVGAGAGSLGAEVVTSFGPYAAGGFFETIRIIGEVATTVGSVGSRASAWVNRKTTDAKVGDRPASRPQVAKPQFRSSGQGTGYRRN